MASNKKSVNEFKDIIFSLKNEGLKKFGTIDLKNLNLKTLETLEPYRTSLKEAYKLKKNERYDWINKQNLFDFDYYELGIQKGKSGYENYRWIPELTMRMAHYMITDLPIKRTQKVLDFGCAKGFLVKALRMFGIESYGVDVSSYAIQSVIPDKWDTHKSCKLIVNWNMPFKKIKFDWIIAKDAIEHLNEEELSKFLILSKKHGKRIFTAVPLGKIVDGKEKFIIENYEGDVTHIIRKPPSWWKKTFEKHGWKIESFKYTMPPIKENWTIPYPKGNGFFILK